MTDIITPVENVPIKFSIIHNGKSYLILDIQILGDIKQTPIMYGFRYRDNMAYSLQFSAPSLEQVPSNTRENCYIDVIYTNFRCSVSTRNTLKTGWSGVDSISVTLCNSDKSILIISNIKQCIPESKRDTDHEKHVKKPTKKPTKKSIKKHVKEPWDDSEEELFNSIPIITLPIIPASSNLLNPIIPEVSENREIKEKRSATKRPAPTPWPMWLDAPIIYDRKKRYGFDLLPQLDV